MKKMWLAFLVLWAVLPRPAAAALSAQGAEDRLIVAFNPGVSVEDGQRIVTAQGLTILDSIPQLRFLLVQARPGMSATAVGTLSANPKVMRVEHDVWRKWLFEAAPAAFAEAPMPSVEAVLKGLPKPAEIRRSASPAKARRQAQAAEEETQWGVKRVNAPSAWPTNQGTGVKVAIIDTGIDPTHPELKDKIAGGHNALDKEASWADDHFHGTHVAGIVAAKLDGKGVVGVAPQATLYAVKVLTKDGQGSLFAIMGGMMWCAQNGIQVANMSLGAPQGNFLFEYAVQMMVQGGVTLVAAAGNGDGKGNPSPVNYPAAYKEAIAVSALDKEDHITKWSSRGPQVAFIAPGFQVPSTVPLSNDATGIHAYSGTSMATPHVAGLAALAVARGAQGPQAVRAALTRAAMKLPGLGGEEQGAGVINAQLLMK